MGLKKEIYLVLHKNIVFCGEGIRGDRYNEGYKNFGAYYYP